MSLVTFVSFHYVLWPLSFWKLIVRIPTFGGGSASPPQLSGILWGRKKNIFQGFFKGKEGCHKKRGKEWVEGEVSTLGFWKSFKIIYAP